MGLINIIKEKGNAIIKEFKELREEDLFAVDIDDSDERTIFEGGNKSTIPPGDDGYGDDESELMCN